MKSVIFSGSNKRCPEQMEIWESFLKENGVDVFIPENFTHHERWQGSIEEVRKFAHELTIDHFEKMKDYDIVLIFNCDGYIGLSTTMELGCAYGLGKGIYAIQPDEVEICRDVLFKGYFKTKEELLDFLRST
jgi:nucleoside 2-deoxyribosyltransferase